MPTTYLIKYEKKITLYRIIKPLSHILKMIEKKKYIDKLFQAR